MTGGRGFDAQVAEKVLGWVELPGKPSLNSFEMGTGLTHWKRPDGNPVPELPSFSTDIAAAWRLASAMAAKGYAIQIVSHESQPKAFTVSFSRDEPIPLNTQSCFLPQVPLAICQAALRAIGA